MTTDSSSESPRETTAGSSSPTPSFPEPAPARARASTAGRSRKKTTRKKTTRKSTSRSRSRAATRVEPGEAVAQPASATSDEKPEPPIGTEQLKKLLERAGGTFHSVGCLWIGVDPNVDPELFRFTKQELDDLAESGMTLAAKSRAVMWLLKKFHWLMFSATVTDYGARNRQAATKAIEKELKRLGLTPEEVIDSDGDPTGSGAPQVIGEARDIPVIGARKSKLPADARGDAVAASEGVSADDELGPSA